MDREDVVLIICIILLLDVGHNPHAAEYLAQRLLKQSLPGRRHAVFGLLADKDLEGVVEPLLPVFDDWAVVPLATTRSRPVAQLQAHLQARGAQVSAWGAVSEALRAQCEHAGEGDEIVLFGSFYCVAEALEWLARHAQGDVQDGFAG